ncbi:nuclear transport factor 2 family protein [Lichenicola cladoniae]|uniref:Nuclear transport factor 2 family protein n=1 Tax=Lichenicola cladoniae TaxID=1484109 RepID=A0A6M8HR11_9PROT|nr:nuclear transport factor 2 family protein [Acetobacteraceae bacterium]QKE90788.1 nuclear transport factor 2 family protein [Lichenicola cladoniae]
MAAFHAAVVAHDGKRLAALFTSSGSSWFNVLSDQRYALARVKAPDAAKIRMSSYQDFADFVSKSKASLDPQHSNLRIQTDGIIASAYFDFRFMIDGKEQNRGSETWQLVRGVDGWRIASISYSSNLPG